MPTPQETTLMRSIGERYGEFIGKASEQLDMEPEHLFNLIYHESRGDSSAVGGDQDTGLTQLLPSTAQEIAGKLGYSEFKDVDELQQQLIDNPGLNILFGAKYYKDALGRAGGDPALAYSMYNAGHYYEGKHPDIYNKIKGGDLSGTDEISSHARDFMSSYAIMGYDPYAPKAPAGPAPVDWEAMDPRFKPVGHGDLGPTRRWHEANRGVHADPRSQRRSSLPITERTPERSQAVLDAR